jgi:hypothetical protein
MKQRVVIVAAVDDAVGSCVSLISRLELQQVAKMLSASNFDSLKNLTSNKTKFSKNNITQ